MNRDLNEERRKHSPSRGNDKDQGKLKDETQVDWQVRREKENVEEVTWAKAL